MWRRPHKILYSILSIYVAGATSIIWWPPLKLYSGRHIKYSHSILSCGTNGPPYSYRGNVTSMLFARLLTSGNLYNMQCYHAVWSRKAADPPLNSCINLCNDPPHVPCSLDTPPPQHYKDRTSISVFHPPQKNPTPKSAALPCSAIQVGPSPAQLGRVSERLAGWRSASGADWEQNLAVKCWYVRILYVH